MSSIYYTSRKYWQKAFIKNIFRKKTNLNDNFSKIIFNDLSLLEMKNEFIPDRLCKYYSPSFENIMNIQKQRLWLSHPKSFNDPFDCKIGFNIYEYKKRSLINYIKKIGCAGTDSTQEGFTKDDLDRITKSTSDIEESSNKNVEYYDEILEIVLNNKSENFRQKINEFICTAESQFETKVKALRNINIRIACFSEIKRYDKFKNNIQMWSHYAENHKGLCVEYDLSSLKNNIVFSLDDYEFYDSKSKYIEERLFAAIKGGLFPVIYTSKRNNFPIDRLIKMKIDSQGNINHKSIIDKILYQTYIVKSTNWKYENEWRIIIDGKISSYFEHNIPFPYIKRIYLGSQMDKNKINTIIEIGKELNVEVVILKMDETKFILEEENKYLYDLHKKFNKLENPFR